jgi:hypothetical protein
MAIQEKSSREQKHTLLCVAIAVAGDEGGIGHVGNLC